ncbi:MAG TPA: ATP-binding cassette domain-containing protein [Thermoplasmata archaeon]|nr:ATP-binding cassette domain-containing protein [Thermoplasmata archaeon]
MRVVETPALSASELTVQYRGVTALAHVSLSARKGEIVALAGPNGSGKTTFVRAVLGLVPRWTGSVEVGGARLESLPLDARARALAWMPQEEALGDNVPILEYVQYGRYAHRPRFAPERAGDRETARRILAELGFADRETSGFHELSGGERQRLRLGRVLAQDAPVLLLDEPTSHLDMGYQLELLERVRRLARSEGKTVIAAIHDLNLAARFADRIVVLHHGRTVADGPPAAVLAPALLRDVWGVVADLRRDVRTGLPYLIPSLPTMTARSSPAARGLRVHVVGGGGSAAPILRALVEDGYRVTLGAVPLFDTDSQTAEELGVATVTEMPFASLSQEVRERHRQLLADADVVVVAPFPVGPGNLANLEDVGVERPGPRVILLEPSGGGTRDFAGGAATRELERLRRGAETVDGVPSLLRTLAASARPTDAEAHDR